MATISQINANQANAKKSTGPRTEAGKENSSRNALKHGLTATRTLVGAEDRIEYHQLRGSLLKDYAPVNAQEIILVDRIASAAWRTLRSRQMEQSLCNMSIDNFQAKRKHNRTRNAKTDTEALVISMVEEDLWRLMHRYDTQISRDFFRSIATLEKMQSDRRRCDRQQRTDDREDQKLLLRQQRADSQVKQNIEITQPNWLPFEKTRTAQHSAQSGTQEQPCATLESNKNASPHYAGTGERNDSSPHVSIPGSRSDCELFHS